MALDVGKRWTEEAIGFTEIRLEERIWQRWWVFDLSRSTSGAEFDHDVGRFRIRPAISDPIPRTRPAPPMS